MDAPRSLDVDRESNRRVFRTRVILAVIVGGIIIAILLVRFIFIQIVNNEKYALLSEENRIQIKPIAPPRGFIFDRQGQVLADLRVTPALALDLESVDDVDETIAKLRELVEIRDSDLAGLREKASSGSRRVALEIIRRQLTDEELAKLAVSRDRFAGVVVLSEYLRHYPFDEVTTHALGTIRRITTRDLVDLDRVAYQSTEFIGGSGLEKTFEQALHGVLGHRIIEVNASGQESKIISEQAPQRGTDISLFLDIELQKFADDALGENRGSIVAVDVQTGGILALVSKPSFDGNLLVRGVSSSEWEELHDPIETPMFNRAIHGTYAPGSTIKPILALAGIAGEVTDWDREITDNGVYVPVGRRGNQQCRDWNWRPSDPGGQGVCDLNRAIYRSSNIYFCTIAEELGLEKISSFLKQFGLSRNETLDLPSASTGIVPSMEWLETTSRIGWNPGDTVNLGIGQGYLSVTPLQMATAALVIARRGNWIQPRLVMASSQPLEETYTSPRSIDTVEGVEPDDWDKLHAAMEAVIHRGDQGFGNNGTAWAHIGQTYKYPIAGKSGTSQVIALGDVIEEDEDVDVPELHRNHAWFIAFSPVKNPLVAIAVLVEHGGSGSEVAAPIAKKVIEKHLDARFSRERA